MRRLHRIALYFGLAKFDELDELEARRASPPSVALVVLAASVGAAIGAFGLGMLERDVAGAALFGFLMGGAFLTFSLLDRRQTLARDRREIDLAAAPEHPET